MARILEHIASNPSCLQKDLPATLGVEKSDSQRACYLAAAAGRLHREKHGSTYALTVEQTATS